MGRVFPPGEKVVLARGRGVPVVRVALLAAERRAALAFVGSRDVDVALAQPLAGAQAGTRLPQPARVVLRRRRRKSTREPLDGTGDRREVVGTDALSQVDRQRVGWRHAVSIQHVSIHE